jgi:hypothetical protein
MAVPRMDKMLANLLLNLQNKDDKIKKEDLNMLQEMFKGSDLTTSVYTTVLKENNGCLDAAIDTLLNLTNDPMLEERQLLLQPHPPSANLIDSLEVETLRHDPVVGAGKEEEEENQVMLSPRDVVPMTDHQLEQEDARLLEEMRLLEEEKRRPMLGTSPVSSSPLVCAASPTFLSSSPVSSPSATLQLAAPSKEVLAILQTQEIMSNEPAPVSVSTGSPLGRVP